MVNQWFAEAVFEDSVSLWLHELVLSVVRNHILQRYSAATTSLMDCNGSTEYPSIAHGRATEPCAPI